AVANSTSECVRTTVFHAGPSRTLADVEFATAGRVDWYNRRRLHSSMGMHYSGRIRDAALRAPLPRSRTHKIAADNLDRFRGRDFSCRYRELFAARGPLRALHRGAQQRSEALLRGRHMACAAIDQD